MHQAHQTRVVHLCCTLVLVYSALLLFGFPRTIRADELCVDPLDVLCYLTIQDAVNAAAPGDTINIHAGTYYEHVTVNKTLAFAGAGVDHTFVDGSGSGRVFYVGTGSVSFSNLTIRNGNVSGNGGGIYNNGTLTVTNCLLSDNTATEGGGIYNNRGAATVMTSTLSGNIATSYGGGMYVYYGVSVIQDSTFSSNLTLSDGSGGGIYSRSSTLKVQHGTFSENSTSSTGNGGGICVGQGVLTVQDSTFAHNSSYFGGAIYTSGRNTTIDHSTFVGNSGRFGGGVVASGMTSVSNSFFSGNVITNAGGGIYNYGKAMIDNCTFSANSATHGGGIWSKDVITVQNSTVYSNTAPYGAGIRIFTDGILNYRNTLIANNIGGDCYMTDTATIGVNLHNFVGDGTCDADLSGDPRLGPLDDYGGNTLTYVLLPDSPAIDAGDNVNCPAADQRGVPRDDLRCDIGAFELRYADSDTVIRTDFDGGTPYSFGPTWISMTLSAADGGTVTVTKHLAYPGGTYDTGEIQATWWISSDLSSGLPVTLSLCYTDDEVTGLNKTTLEVFRWNDSAWVDQNATPDASNNCVILAGAMGFSAWTLKDTSVGELTPTALTLTILKTSESFGVLGVVFVASLVGVVGLTRKRQR